MEEPSPPHARVRPNPTLPPRPALRAAAAALLAAAAFAAGSALAAAFAHRLPLAKLLGDDRWNAVARGLGAALFLAVAALALEVRALARRAPGPSAAPLRLAVALLVLSAALFVALVDPYKRLYVQFALGFAAGAYALLRLLALLVPRAAAARPLRLADFVLFQLALATIAGEVALRTLARVRPSPVLAQVDESVEARLARERFAPRAIRMGTPCNSLGFYDAEFTRRKPGEVVVAAIGDSFSASIVPLQFHFSTVFERALPGVRLDNYGASGTGPREYLFLLSTEVLPLDPSLVIANVFVGNDIEDANEVRRGDLGLRRWLDRAHVLLWQVPRRLAILRRETDATGRGAANLGQPAGETWDGKRIDSEADLVAKVPWLTDWQQETSSFAPETYLVMESNRALTTCASAASEYQAALDQLLEMKRACASTPFAVAIIPDEFQVEDPLWERVLDATQARHMERDLPQRRLIAFLEEHDIPVLDLLPILRAEPVHADGWRHLYYKNDSHWNAYGNRAAGEALARFAKGLLGL